MQAHKEGGVVRQRNDRMRSASTEAAYSRGRCMKQWEVCQGQSKQPGSEFGQAKEEGGLGVAFLEFRVQR